MSSSRDSQPIIVGTGQGTWRDKDPERTPIDALESVALQALENGGAALRSAIDAVVHVPFILDQVPQLAGAMPGNPGAAISERLGLSARQFTADVGGNLPQDLVTEFSARLCRGEHHAVLIGGVELLATFLGELRAGRPLAWESGIDDRAECLTATPAMTSPSEQAHGLFEPTHAYPLFESALRHASGLDGTGQARQLGALIASMSEVAKANPLAWKRERWCSDDVLSTERGNRMICYPYTKVMNSLIAVDQAAALVLTTVGKARELGIDPEHWVYLRGAAGANDRWYLSERNALHRSPALSAAGGEALRQSAMALEELRYFDLYSCFPCAVHIACDALGLAPEDSRGVTVTGGMSLFGGPGNNYSLHAIATLVDRLRDEGSGAGLVSANGGYLTKHAVGVYAREPGPEPWQPVPAHGLQRQLDEEPFLEREDVGQGGYVIDAHTVSFDRQGPRQGILLGRLDNGRRCLAKSESPEVIEALLASDCVGQRGALRHRDGVNLFEF